MRNVLAAAFLLVVCLLAGPILAQDMGGDVGIGGEGDTLPSGGGDGGTQFPSGTDNCAGDRHHHAHDWPTNLCVLSRNPHYFTKLAGGDSCAGWSRNCDACYNCCDFQKTEAEACHCFEQRCKDAQVEVRRTCRHSCFGQFLDGCSVSP